MADVLVCASSIHGHVAPMLEVARHLRVVGHTVRMTTGTRFAGQVAAADVEFVPLQGLSDIDDSDLDTVFPGRSQTRGVGKVRFDVSHLFIRPMPSQWEVLSGELQRRPADVVLYETTFMGIAPLLAARRARPPVIGCGVIPLTLSSPRVPPFGAGLPYAQGPAARFRNRVVREGIRRLVLGGPQR
jgi:UDP:flavonoid glycosyltransferase YjiC (YdhE family)